MCLLLSNDKIDFESHSKGPTEGLNLAVTWPDVPQIGGSFCIERMDRREEKKNEKKKNTGGRRKRVVTLLPIPFVFFFLFFFLCVFHSRQWEPAVFSRSALSFDESVINIPFEFLEKYVISFIRVFAATFTTNNMKNCSLIAQKSCIQLKFSPLFLANIW